MAIQALEVWCRELVTDGVTDTDNRRDLLTEETLNGWVRLGTVSTQQMNSLFYLCSSHSKPNPFSPELHLSAKAIPSVAIEWSDGGAIVEADTPELYEYYGATFPTLGAAPSGWTYIVRAQ
jgi:hypothetical protein